jgi:hypothetical protein
MKITEKLVTPAFAAQILQSNVQNRRVKLPVLLRYVEEITQGKWVRGTGELIKISKSNILLDGQHRLMAVAKTGIPTWFHIAEECDEEIFKVLDTGSTRNAGDIFNINGVKNCSKLPSIIQFYYFLKKNKGQGLSVDGVQKNLKYSNHALWDLYENNQQLFDYVATKTAKLYNSFGKVLTTQVIGGMYLYFRDINIEDADEFMEQLCSGQNIKNNSIAILRAKLIADKIATRKMALTIKHALIIKTWNFYRTDTVIKLIKFDPSVEKTPVAI